MVPLTVEYTQMHNSSPASMQLQIQRQRAVKSSTTTTLPSLFGGMNVLFGKEIQVGVLLVLPSLYLLSEDTGIVSFLDVRTTVIQS